MKQQYKYIKVDITRHCLTITLNRIKKKNALNPTMITEIQNILDSNKENDNIRTVLINSSSSVFCAGADLEYLNEIRQFSYKENLTDSQILMSLFQTMLSYPKLIISKVCGAALGGGCGIVTASDIIFATKEAHFGYPEVKIGFTPALVSSFLIEKINLSNVRELFLTGKIIDAHQAKDISLINFICSTNNIDEEINVFTQKFITKTSPQSIQTTKQLLYEQTHMKEKLEEAAKLNAKSRMNNDFKKGIRMFLEKQTINWN
ncbi:MAG: methylglutaconyl-CoA hydratase [Flavobacteriales bacterium]|nr:methylglutaconyl-CoA hydratase [Flavobacteriales bacterium]